MGAAAGTCTRILGGQMPTASALNTYLASDVPLSDSQRACFWRVVADWRQHAQAPVGIDRMAKQVATSWEQGHLRALGLGENTGGYGGLLRTEHVKTLLQAAGQSMLAAQLRPQHQPRMLRQPPPVPRQQPAPASSNFTIATAQPAKKRNVTTIVHVYKGMTQIEINRLTLVEIKKALAAINEPSSGKHNKSELESRLFSVIQGKEDGFKASFEYLK
jgi:hypothetical protein